MDRLLLLLVVAAVAGGVVFVGSTMMNERAASTASPGEQSVTEAPEERKLAEEGLAGQEKPEKMVRRKESELPPTEVKSLDFKVDVRSDDEDYATRFRIREPGTDNEDIRIDSTKGDGTQMSIILKGSTDEGWVKDYSSSEWTYFTGIAFTQMWQSRANRYLAYRVGEWKEMEGGEFTVRNRNGRGRVYDISVNRGIPESVFSP